MLSLVGTFSSDIVAPSAVAGHAGGSEAPEVSWLSSGSNVTLGNVSGVRRAVATIEHRQSMPGQLLAVEAENNWLRRTVQLERLVQRSLLQVAVDLQQAKGEAFQMLRRHAACQAWAASDQKFPSPRQKAFPALDRATEAPVISARWLGCLLGEAQRKLAGAAWSELVEHANLSRSLEAAGVGASWQRREL